MRKLLALIVAASSIGFTAVFGAANTPDPSAAGSTADKQQIRIQIGNRNRNQNRNRNRFRNRNRGIRRTTMTRIIWVGRQRYREVIEITYLPNGRTMTRVISRVRVR